MPVSITFNVDPDLLKRCADIIGEPVVIDRDGRNDIEIVATKYSVNANTKLIQGIYGSLDALNLKDVPANVTVCSNPGAFTDSAAEQAFALILSTMKKDWKRELGMELWIDGIVHRFFGGISDRKFNSIYDDLSTESSIDLINKTGDIDFPSRVVFSLFLRKPSIPAKLLFMR